MKECGNPKRAVDLTGSCMPHPSLTAQVNTKQDMYCKSILGPVMLFMLSHHCIKDLLEEMVNVKWEQKAHQEDSLSPSCIYS